MAKGTSQACSYRSQESYFRHSQLLKETMYNYEAFHLDSDIARLIIATVAHLQQELQETKDERQKANDQAIDTNVHRCEAENEVAKIKRDLFAAEQATLEARGTDKRYNTHNRETLIELEWALSWEPNFL